MRQKVAFVVNVSLSFSLSRITEFSPVSITQFASTVLIIGYLQIRLSHRVNAGFSE
jgi:hypothetical protein